MLARTRSRRHFLQRSAALTSVGLLAGCGMLPSTTPWSPRMRRIGYLSPFDRPESDNPFLQGMRDLGWVEGQNLTVERRSAEGRYDRFPALADDLVRAGVELIYARTGIIASAAQQVTGTVPIVFANSADPVASGLVASLGHPGGNLTGLTIANLEVTAKRVQLLKDVAPGTTHLAVLRNAQPAGLPTNLLRAVEDGARTFGLEISYVDHLEPGADQLEQAFSIVLPRRPDALLVIPAPTLDPLAPRIAEIARANRLPSIGDDLIYARAGLLLSYGVSYADVERRAATYADKILKGARPADLPVEKPTKFDFGVNLKTASALGLTIPPSVFAQTTELIQ